MNEENDEIQWHAGRVKLSELKPWDHNPKQITRASARRLLAFWKKIGQFQTIACGPGGELYDGHQRYDTLMAAFGGDYEVDVRISSRALTEEERKELSIQAHIGTVGVFNWDELASWDAPALIQWGLDKEGAENYRVSSSAIRALINAERVIKDAAPKEDKLEELLKRWKPAAGQLWIIESASMPGETHRLICGDCTDKNTVETLMLDDRAHLTITSPPYAVGKEYEVEISFEQHLQLLRGFADQTIGITLPGGFIFVNFGEIAANAHAAPLTGSERQCVYPISLDYWTIFHEERGCDLYAARVWYKPFNRLQQPFWSYHTSIPHHQEWEHLWTWRTPGGEGDRVCDWDISVHAIWDTRNEEVEDHPLTRHVAAFPICLPIRALKAHSLEGDIVFEPFCGSGTTIVACENLSRRCRAVELSQEYLAVALQRLHDIGLKPKLAKKGK